MASEQDIYTLARVMHSEWGDGPAIGRAAIGHATLNEAALARKNITDFATAGRGYGSQEDHRPVSTARAPNDEDITISRAIFDGQIPDFTNGANKFFDPRSQARKAAEYQVKLQAWVAAGSDPNTKPVRYLSPPDLIAKWQSEGNKVLPPIRGIDPNELVLFRKGEPGEAVYAGITSGGGMAAIIFGAAIAYYYTFWRKS